jgi:hypothetical protein
MNQMTILCLIIHFKHSGFHTEFHIYNAISQFETEFFNQLQIFFGLYFQTL